MDRSILREQPASPSNNTIQSRAFLMLLLALSLFAIAEASYGYWCYPYFGDSACNRYSIPVNLLLDLTFFMLVVLVFDRPWSWLALFSLVASLIYTISGLIFGWFAPLVVHTFPSFHLTGILPYLVAVFAQLGIIGLMRIFIPAAILRGLVRGSWQNIHLFNALAYGVVMAGLAEAYVAGIFTIAYFVQPGSVSPGSIFTFFDLMSTLISAVTIWVAILLGKSIRARQATI